MIMNKLKADSETARGIFDAVPVPIFVVDEDVRILDANIAGAAILGASPQQFLRKRGGEALHCLQDSRAPGGCGQSEYCKDCVMRNGVYAAFGGQSISRQRADMELIKDGKVQNVVFWVTTTPFQYTERKAALLVLEDVTELFELRRLIPICAKCKKIRDDQQYWHRLEQYMYDHLHLDFTHGLCPDCLKELMAEHSLSGSPKKSRPKNPPKT